MMNTRAMTDNDSVVLSQIFDPEAAPTSNVLVDPMLPEDPCILDPKVLLSIKQQVKRIILKAESSMKDPKGSTGRDTGLREACREIDALVEEYPNYASLRNDRAQLIRLQYDIRLVVPSSEAEDSVELMEQAKTALGDLDVAIKLLTPAALGAAVSPAHCRTLSQAYTQRGALFHAAAKAFTRNTGMTMVLVDRFATWTQLDFEEAASKDFFMGGRYGNEIGKALAVHTNPTAKLCGQMVQEAMRREYAPSLPT